MNRVSKCHKDKGEKLTAKERELFKSLCNGFCQHCRSMQQITEHPVTCWQVPGTDMEEAWCAACCDFSEYQISLINKITNNCLKVSPSPLHDSDRMALREKIAEILDDNFDTRCLTSDGKGGFEPFDLTEKVATELLALIEPYIEQLAKERGWVKLAKDQTLPPNPATDEQVLDAKFNHNNIVPEYIQLAYTTSQEDMFAAGWRKVDEK